MARNRDKYFRMRTRLGKMEAAALMNLIRLGHTPFFVKNDRFSTGIGCHECDAWACVEIESGLQLAHGSLFEELCGTTIIKRGDEYESNAAQY